MHSTSSPTVKISRKERGLPTEITRFVKISLFVAPFLNNKHYFAAVHIWMLSLHILIPAHVFGIPSINLLGIAI